MEKFGCPRKFTALVRQLQVGMRATVLDNGDTSDSFPVTNGVKQGCVLAPTLCSMVFAATLHDASQDNDDGIQLKYRTDRGVFNLRRLKANTKVKVTTLREIIFADDCALNSNTEERKCNSAWIIFLKLATTLVLPSAPRRQKSITSLYRERCSTSHTSLRRRATESYRLFHLPGKHPLQRSQHWRGSQ